MTLIKLLNYLVVETIQENWSLFWIYANTVRTHTPTTNILICGLTLVDERFGRCNLNSWIGNRLFFVLIEINSYLYILNIPKPGSISQSTENLNTPSDSSIYYTTDVVKIPTFKVLTSFAQCLNWHIYLLVSTFTSKPRYKS